MPQDWPSILLFSLPSFLQHQALYSSHHSLAKSLVPLSAFMLGCLCRSRAACVLGPIVKCAFSAQCSTSALCTCFCRLPTGLQFPCVKHPWPAPMACARHIIGSLGTDFALQVGFQGTPCLPTGTGRELLPCLLLQHSFPEILCRALLSPSPWSFWSLCCTNHSSFLLYALFMGGVSAPGLPNVEREITGG